MVISIDFIRECSVNLLQSTVDPDEAALKKKIYLVLLYSYLLYYKIGVFYFKMTL